MKDTRLRCCVLLCLALCLLFTVTACADKEEPHTHIFGDWRVSVAPTHDEPGEEVRVCNSCHERETREIPKVEHTFSEVWDYNPTQHWHSCSCGAADAPEDHDFDKSGHCRICGADRALLHYTKSGTSVTFGSYPKTAVTDGDLIERLNETAGELPVPDASGAWMLGSIEENGDTALWQQDLTLDGNVYRAVYFTSYRPMATDLPANADCSQQDDNGYAVGTVYWFRFEPITWHILREENGYALLLADFLLDALPYQGVYKSAGTKTVNGTTMTLYHTTSHGAPAGTDANTYAYSTVRAYLLYTFLTTAFSEEEISVIAPADLTEPLSQVSEEGDPVFLLSSEEVAAYLQTRESLLHTVTDYTACRGAVSLRVEPYNGCGAWWLRSPAGGDTANVRIVSAGGATGTSAYSFARNTSVGVAPALWIRLA